MLGASRTLATAVSAGITALVLRGAQLGTVTPRSTRDTPVIPRSGATRDLLAPPVVRRGHGESLAPLGTTGDGGRARATRSRAARPAAPTPAPETPRSARSPAGSAAAGGPRSRVRGGGSPVPACRRAPRRSGGRARGRC